MTRRKPSVNYRNVHACITTNPVSSVPASHSAAGCRGVPDLIPVAARGYPSQVLSLLFTLLLCSELECDKAGRERGTTEGEIAWWAWDLALLVALCKDVDMDVVKVPEFRKVLSEAG